MAANRRVNCVRAHVLQVGADGDAVDALGGTWHAACFVCRECGAALCGGFYEHHGLPLCAADYALAGAGLCVVGTRVGGLTVLLQLHRCVQRVASPSLARPWLPAT